jgi:hypothetical protein
MAQVNPSGNLAESNKHGFFRIETTGREIAINVPRTVLDEFDVGAFLLSLHWDDAAAGPPPGLTLVSPNGDELSLDAGAEDGVVWFDEHVVFNTPDRTSRGTSTRFIFVGSEDGRRPMRFGDYILRVDPQGAAFDMHVFVDDYFSSWGEGVGLFETDPATTICWPATGDAALGVGAYAGFQDQPWDGDGSLRGELRNYSSRGPRMDGEVGIDIVAPDDPLSPIPAGEIIPGSYGWYGRFGGTSGAGPHVAGAMALLRQVYPSATVPELEARLIDNTLRDLGDELPSPNSGWGKLRIFEAVDPSLREGNAAPVIDVVAVDSNEVALDVRGTVDGDRDEVVYVVDLGYDGEPDFGPAPGPFLQLDAPQGEYVAVVYAYDGRGGRDGIIVHGVVGDVEAALDAGPPPTPDPEDVGDSGSEPDPVDVGVDLTNGAGGSGGCGCSATQRGVPAIAWLALLALVWRRRAAKGATR